ncbi:MAG: hypothetical protein PHY48_02225 [Candidatus Cloacimonetes bacterium]|nr:hypothetical protein [Candidatus Cloacimonadota bacterium]
MPKRFWILILIVIVLGLSGCAKRNTAYQEDEWLTLEKQIPLVGDPLDFCFDDSYIYTAQDQGGISSIRRSDYYTKWYTDIKAADGSDYVLTRIPKIEVVGEYHRLFLNETGSTDRIIIMDASNPDSLVWTETAIGGTQGIQDMDFQPTVPSGTEFPITGGYCTSGTFYFTKYKAVEGLFNQFSITPPPPFTANGFAMTDTHVFIASQQRGLLAYNRSNQQLVSEFAIPGSALKVKIAGNYAFIASRQGGLNIVNITNPAAPVLIANFSTPNFTTAIDVSGNRIAISSGSGGVYLFDVSNVNQPVLLQRLTSCGYANTVKFMDAKLVIASRDQGLLVYSIR